MTSPRQLSVRQVIDLFHAGPEMARRMGQEAAMRAQAPEALACLEEIIERLRAVGCDGLELLRSDGRLWSVLNLYEIWKGMMRQMGVSDPDPAQPADEMTHLDEIIQRLDAVGCDGLKLLRTDPALRQKLAGYAAWQEARLTGGSVPQRLTFRIYGSPHHRQAEGMLRLLKQMQASRRRVLLELTEGELRLTCGELSLCLPATFEQAGKRFVYTDFLPLLMQALARDELVDCTIEGEYYTVNRAWFRPKQATG